MTKVIITGAKGRMGQALIACATRFPDLEVITQVDEGDSLGSVISKANVVIDFSLHSATPDIVNLCAKNKKAVVIGTTGHSEAEAKAIRTAQTAIPMVWASNFSTGVN